MSPVYLNDFKIENPKNCYPQDELLNWIIQCHQKAELGNPSEKMSSDSIQKLFQRYAVKPDQISQRFIECSDILSQSFADNEIYQLNQHLSHGVDIQKRAYFFSERALEIFHQFYDSREVIKPNHLIHVTCTGYVSPSAAQRIVTDKNWDTSTDITHAYHMGCYAALPAIRIAKSLVQSESVANKLFKTDIVHNEMCGLHMNPLAQTPEQMVVQTLFADGHIKYSATTNLNSNGGNLKILALHEKIVPDTELDMSWVPAPWGMQMNLSREVPQKIKSQLKNFSNELFQKANLDLSEALGSVFAIHPGGPKIIKAVQECLELQDQRIRESTQVLFQRGNMSSATLPHVWDLILKNQYPEGTKIISYAFGPGLTLFGSVFEVCK
jgi:predicted naringenin-chalcone synthase